MMIKFDTKKISIKNDKKKANNNYKNEDQS
jgi:hypothetical protein